MTKNTSESPTDSKQHAGKKSLQVQGFAVHLGVLHHTVDAVKVAHVIHCLGRVLQHAPHRLHKHTHFS